MAFYRQLLVLTVPSVAVLFGIYWYRRKRGCANSDPGGNTRNIKTLKQELEEASPSMTESTGSPAKQLNKSAPIDIMPNGINSQRSSPLQLTDKQLDLEIEKAKSQKFYEMEYPLKKNSKENTPPSMDRAKSFTSRTPSPLTKSPMNGDALSRTAVEDIILVTDSKNQILSCKLNNDLATQSNNKVEEEVHAKSESPLKEVIAEEDIKIETAHLSACSLPKVAEKSKNNKKSKKQSKDSKTVKRNVFAESTDGVPVEAVKEEIVANSDKHIVKCEIVQVEQENIGGVLDSVTPVTSLISEEQDNHNVERDSNRSPVDGLLASPSINSFFDNHSEGSNDSGKGCSESPSPPPTNVGDLIQNSNGILRHQFFIPHAVVGLLIGSKRSFLQRLNEVSAAKVFIKSHPETRKLKICVIEGIQQDIDSVLDIIRQKLPKKRFPSLNMNDISGDFTDDEFAYISDCYHLNLVECVNNDTIVSCLVSPSQIFLQQPMHPTYPSLHMLHTLMGVCYQDPQVPSLPSIVTEGMVCAAPTANNWYRTQIITTNIDQNTSLLKLVDFGGFMEVNHSLLKQIRLDFMMLPFQATEVQLAHIAPVDGGEWPPEAVQVLAGLSSGQLLQAQVVGYDEIGMPQVYLYLTLGPQQVISLNRELVVRGLAEWIGPES